jgi:general secretion pathway protein C
MQWDWSQANAERASRFGALGVAALSALTGLWIAVKLLWLLLGSGAGIDTAPAPMTAGASPAGPIVSIAKWHLFGNGEVFRAEAARNSPKTQLRLSLHGTLAEADPKTGMAMIADDTGAERAYRVGDLLPGGATLDEIYPDRVMLLHEGASETLALPVDQPSAPPNPNFSAPATAASGNTASRNTQPGIALPPGLTYTPPIGTGQVDMSRLQQQLGVDPASLARQVTALPVLVNGKMTGVRLSGGPEALVAKLGLKPDDVVTSVNGMPLDSPARLPQLVESLKNAARVEATVLRDGKPVTISVNLK